MSNEEYRIEWVSGVNQKGEGFVQLVKVWPQQKKRDLIAQLTPAQKRDVLLNAMEAAEAAETDAFLVYFLKAKLNVAPAALAAILLDFRDFRARSGRSMPTQPEHWNAVMDELAMSKTRKPFDPTKKQ